MKVFNAKYNAQSAGSVEYIECISAEGWDSPNDIKQSDTKQSDGEALVILEHLGNVEYPFNTIAPGSTLAWSGSTSMVLSMDKMELNCVITLKWIVWN